MIKRSITNSGTHAAAGASAPIRWSPTTWSRAVLIAILAASPGLAGPPTASAAHQAPSIGTVTTLTAALNPAPEGLPVPLQATTYPFDGHQGALTGNVQFTSTYSSGQPWCTAPVNNTSACTTPVQAAGVWTLRAAYTGDQTYMPSSTQITEVVVPSLGYWLVAGDGGVFPFGAAGGYGSTGGMRLNRPVVGMAATFDGSGYWLVASDGGVFPFGSARGFGSTGGMKLNAPIVALIATLDNAGYWLIGADGGVFPFGDAYGAGSAANVQHRGTIVGAAVPRTGGFGPTPAYVLASSGGDLIEFPGGAISSDSPPHLNQPLVAIATDGQLGRIWLVAADGGVFPIGASPGYGSLGNTHLNQPIDGAAGARDVPGYWLVAGDGGIFPFQQYGLSLGFGSLGGRHLNQPIVGMAATSVPHGLPDCSAGQVALTATPDRSNYTSGSPATFITTITNTSSQSCRVDGLFQSITITDPSGATVPLPIPFDNGPPTPGYDDFAGTVLPGGQSWTAVNVWNGQDGSQPGPPGTYSVVSSWVSPKRTSSSVTFTVS